MPTRFSECWGFRLVLSVPLVVASFSIAAADPVALRYSEDWQYGLTVYGFLPSSLKGTSTIAGTDVDLDLDFQDAIELLDF